MDPAFTRLQPHIDQLAQIAWENYVEAQNYVDAHKAPRTRKAGPALEDPDGEVSIG